MELSSLRLVSNCASPCQFFDSPEPSEELRGRDVLQCLVRRLCRFSFEEVPPLPGQIAEVKGQDANQQDFHIVDESLVLDDVPAKPVPTAPSAIAFVCCPESLANIPFPDVDWRRSVVQNIDALAALASAWHLFNVFGIACPSLAEAINQCH